MDVKAQRHISTYTGRHTREYLSVNVVEAARERMRHVFDIFDIVVVMFSGGKDSLVCLHLAREVAEQRGALPLNVCFKDPELVPRSVIHFVDGYRQKDWVRMIWMCVPINDSRYILGQMKDLIWWDSRREFARPKPDFAIGPSPEDPFPFDGDMNDRFVARLFPVGKLAFITGIRASESPTRYASCVQKINENYINQTCVSRAHVCKPIYDWTDKDAFKFLHDNAIAYAPSYDAQHLTGLPLRTGSGLNPHNAKRLDAFKAAEPELYQQMVKIFPDIAIQERYYSDLNRTGVQDEYGQDWAGLFRYIENYITSPKFKSKAIAYVNQAKRLHSVRPESYPISFILKRLSTGDFSKQKAVLPKTTKGGLQRA